MAAIKIGGRGKEPADGSKRAKISGMPPNVGTWVEAVTPTQFCKVMIKLVVGFLPISEALRPYLDSVSNTVTLKLTTGCQWDITISDVDGKACFDQGWAPFVVAHDLKISYLVTLKKIYPKIYKVVIYYYTQAEVCKRCPEHPEASRRIVKRQ